MATSAIGKGLFPRGCFQAYDDDGSFGERGRMFLESLDSYYQEGKGIEHPCYNCPADSCDLRKAGRFDESKRYIIEPEAGSFYRNLEQLF